MLIDTGGNRHNGAELIGDVAAARRAKGSLAKVEAKRTPKGARARIAGSRQKQTSCITKASFGEELTMVKAIVRYIARHDLKWARLFSLQLRRGSIRVG